MQVWQSTTLSQTQTHTHTQLDLASSIGCCVSVSNKVRAQKKMLCTFLAGGRCVGLKAYNRINSIHLLIFLFLLPLQTATMHERKKYACKFLCVYVFGAVSRVWVIA